MTLSHSYDSFEIRQGGADDLDAVLNLWQQLPGIMLRAEDSPAALQPLLDDGRLGLIVAHSGAEIVGAVLVGEDGRRGHLYHLAVAERKQGLGLGRALVDVALGELAARGIERSHVFVHISNSAACGFWAHLGWCARPELAVFSHVRAGPEGN